MAKSWIDVVKGALNLLYTRDDIAYFYGAKGQRLTDDVMNILWNSYPGYFCKYNDDQKQYIFDYSRNKIGGDCSWLTGTLFGDMTYSGAQREHCSAITTPKDGVAGSLLYKPGHVGVDIGYGYFIHLPEEGRTVELGKISDYNWTESGRHKNVDYMGASNV